MKKKFVLIIIGTFFGLFLSLSHSHAQIGSETITFDDDDAAIFNDIPLEDSDRSGYSLYQPTSSEKIALLYHKMIKKTPNFKLWATHTKDYKAAPEFQKDITLDEKISEWTSEFDLMTIKENIIIETVISISKYNNRFKGYLIRGMDEETFFNYSFVDTDVVVIPKQIEDHQWFTLGLEQSQIIESALNSKRQAYIRIILNPKYADAKSALPIGKKNYWLLLGDIAKIELLSLQGRQTLWASDQDFLSDKKQKELMDSFNPQF